MIFAIPLFAIQLKPIKKKHYFVAFFIILSLMQIYIDFTPLRPAINRPYEQMLIDLDTGKSNVINFWDNGHIVYYYLKKSSVKASPNRHRRTPLFVNAVLSDESIGAKLFDEEYGKEHILILQSADMVKVQAIKEAFLNETESNNSIMLKSLTNKKMDYYELSDYSEYDENRYWIWRRK
jgi:hypothetical protein